MKQKSKKLGKRGAIAWLAILCVVIALASVLTFVQFDYGDDGIKHYKSVVGAIKLGIDLKGGVYVVMQPKTADMTEEEIDKIDINGIIEILRSRLDAKGYVEATIVRQGTNGIRVEIPDVDNPEEVFNIIGKQAVLEFRRPDDSVIFTGKNIGNAYATMESQTSTNYAVAVEIDKTAQKAFAKATGELVNQSIGIYLDNEMISNPSVQTAIDSDSFIITGMGTGADGYQRALDTALLLRSGSLPVEFEQIEPRTLSSQLGQDAINVGLYAGGLGVLAVLIFMAVFYRGFGLCADLALVVFVVLLLFLMSQLPWVQLTLPGIAGIILSIGMAVDANVIIFERIRDEYLVGKSLRASVKSGFQRALTAIIDSNVTAILSGVIMWLLGTGSIQGFAVTLVIGIVVSFFTCITVTRTLIYLFLAINERSEKFYGVKREEAVNE